MHVQTAVSLQFEAFRDTVYPSDWRVEAINPASGDVFVTIFCGPLAQEEGVKRIV
jgi:hypothetical protein